MDCRIQGERPCYNLEKVNKCFFMMDEATISNCGAISSTGEDEGNVAHLTASEDNKSLAPYVGMEFQSHEEAQKFYRVYAKSVGFGTKVHNSHCRVIGGKRQLWYITFACEREGFKREMQHVENPRPNCRVGCKAEMRIKRKGRNDCMWICYFVATEHNHDVGPLLPDLIRAKRISDQRKIARAHKTMIQRSKVKQLSIETEGMDKLNDRRREVKNFIDGDVNAIQKLFAERSNVDGAITTYAVKDMITKENGVVERKEYEVTFDALEIKVSCICCMFEFQGILCNHALSVLYAVEVTQIPSRYMLQRWRKDFKRIHALNGDREQAQVNNAVDRFNDLWHRFIQFADEAATTTERYLFAVQALSEATNKLRHMGGCPNIDLRASASPNLISERSPQISTFGNTCKASESNEMNCMSKILDLELEAEGGPLNTKRFKPHLETLRGKTRAKNCSICKRPGHTRVTCEEGEVNFGSKNLQPVTFNYHF
ncbi:hypothetical protein MRB53_005935 [Persea americana]|uniref:Uncharacterized protein n=1 Tax=Persea americana TaxID=3435 RepID=A0ACC2MEI7_PERAE|nr:hypothetical protein MRB53_005935 [Persea americana]